MWIQKYVLQLFFHSTSLPELYSDLFLHIHFNGVNRHLQRKRHNTSGISMSDRMNGMHMHVSVMPRTSILYLPLCLHTENQ